MSTEPHVILVVAADADDASQAAVNLGLRSLVNPGWPLIDDLPYAGIVYVEGWQRSTEPAGRIAEHVEWAREHADVTFTEVEQRTSAWFFRGQTLARQAQAVLDAERVTRDRRAVLGVSPETLATYAAPAVRPRRNWLVRLVLRMTGLGRA